MEGRCNWCYGLVSECETGCTTLSHKELKERRNENLRWYPLREGEVIAAEILQMAARGITPPIHTPLEGFEKDSFEYAKATLSEAFAKYCPKMNNAGFYLSFQDISPYNLTANVHISADLCFEGKHLTLFWSAWCSNRIYFISSTIDRMEQVKVDGEIREEHVPKFFRLFETRVDSLKRGEHWNEPPTYEIKGERLLEFNYITLFGNLSRVVDGDLTLYCSEFFGIFGDHDLRTINSMAKKIYDRIKDR